MEIVLAVALVLGGLYLVWAVLVLLALFAVAVMALPLIVSIPAFFLFPPFFVVFAVGWVLLALFTWAGLIEI